MSQTTSKTENSLPLFSLIVSLMAIMIAGLAFHNHIPSGDFYNKVITIVGLVVGVIGVGATVYFVVMGINITEKNNQLNKISNDYDALKDSYDENMKTQYKETTNILSVIESVEGIHQATTRLALGRIILQNLNYSTDDETETGIMYLNQYGETKEDIKLLEKMIIHNPSVEDKKLKKSAKKAIEIINERLSQSQILIFSIAGHRV